MGNNILNTLYKVASVSLITGFVLISSCKKEEPCCDANNPECPNYDPCYNKSMASANFTFGEVCTIKSGFKQAEYHDSIIFSDTIYRWNSVEFSVEQTDYDSLKWYIGTETLTTPTFRRKDFPANQMVEVTLVVWKTADRNCFPNTPISDTLTKNFYSAEHPVYYQKRYKGTHLSAPSDSVFVSFVDNEFLNIPSFCAGTYISGSAFSGYRYFIFTTIEINNGCVDNNQGVRLTGYATDSTFEVNYKYIDGPVFSGGPFVNDYFFGEVDN